MRMTATLLSPATSDSCLEGVLFRRRTWQLSRDFLCVLDLKVCGTQPRRYTRRVSFSYAETRLPAHNKMWSTKEDKLRLGSFGWQHDRVQVDTLDPLALSLPVCASCCCVVSSLKLAWGTTGEYEIVAKAIEDYVMWKRELRLFCLSLK